MSRPTTAAQKAWNNKANTTIAGEVALRADKGGETTVSWWIGLERPAFYTEAAKRAPAMSHSKIGRSVGGHWCWDAPLPKKGMSN